MVTTVLTVSSAGVGSPSLVSFSEYISGSLVGLLERKITRLPSSRRASIRRLAPGRRTSPR